MIYFDNAATTLQKPAAVTEAIVSAFSTMGNAGRGVHEHSLDSSRVIFRTRHQLATLFNATDSKQIAFTANATESLNIAILGLIQPGDHVITTVMEHNSVLRPLYHLEKQGVNLSIIGTDSKGVLDYEQISQNILPETKAIVMTHGSNLTGNLVDIPRVSQIAKTAGILLIVDASQTAGLFSIDVAALAIDALCFTGHKSLLGPQGTGGLYLREGLAIQPLKYGGTGVETYNHNQPQLMPTRLEAGTLNGHGIAGLSAALDYLEITGLPEIQRIEKILTKHFYEGVKGLPGVTIYGDFSSFDRCPIVSLNIHNRDSSDVSDQLMTEFDIATRSGGHCAPLMHQTLGTVEQGAVRFSFSHFNTLVEVNAAIAALQKITFS